MPNPSQVIYIGDHDWCVVCTAAQTKWMNDNWDYYNKQGKLDWMFKELLKSVRNGPLVIKILNILSIKDYFTVRILLNRAAAFNYCFVYAIDEAGKVPGLGKPWRGPKLRAVKDKNHVNLMGIVPGRYDYVETKLDNQKYIRVYGYP
jgi:hypothetical protein